mgnify:CR=1 FL=1
MLSEDIRRYEARCAHHLALHAPVHHAAINKVRSVAAQLWPRAQVKTFGSFATGLMRPGSDIDLIVTLPPRRFLIRKLPTMALHVMARSQTNPNYPQRAPVADAQVPWAAPWPEYAFADLYRV